MATHTSSLSRRSVIGHAAGAGVVAALAAAGPGAVAGFALGTADSSEAKGEAIMSQATPTNSTAAAPTVVLVHGAFADAGSWAGVVERLQAAGIPTLAPANPLRGVPGDSAYIASVVDQIPGPVLLVGHSYGGAVITNAGAQAGNVVGLVYVAAYALDEGETLADYAARFTDNLIGPALRPTTFPSADGGEPGQEFSIDPASFHEVFCADLPAEQAAVLAASQRPLAAVTFMEKSGAPAWRTLPSWAIVATADKALGPTGERSEAERAGATIVEVDASHVLMISQPQAVTDLIMTALEAVS